MKKWLKRIGLTIGMIAALAATLLAYAYFIEPNRLVITEDVISVPNFSAELNGLKIVGISDIHGGSNGVTEERLRGIVVEANKQEPDLIVLLGDYISEKRFDRDSIRNPGRPNRTELRMPVSVIADNLAGFNAKYGTYAVIGNHDWWYNESEIRREFGRVGIKFLENEVEQISIGNQTINLWGIEDYWRHRRVPVANSYEKIAEKKNIIAITHNPDSLLKTPDGIALMIAGHSHGGQVNFPIYGPHPFVNDPRFMKGEAFVDGKHVFVTTGVGCTGPQIRFRVPPEIAVITINAAQ